MTRVKVLIDYQNVYHSARRSFGLWDEHPIAEHVRPLRLGVLVKQLGDDHDPERELIEVRVYRGEPTNKSHPTLQAAFQRQVAGWRTREPSLITTTRPLRYNVTRRDGSGRPVAWDAGEEKGIVGAQRSGTLGIVPTPKNPADFHDMDEPLNVEGDPDEVLTALLALKPDDGPDDD